MGGASDGVIVGHHIGHDIETMNAGYLRHFGTKLENRSLDTMELTLHLEKDGAFAGREEIRSSSALSTSARLPANIAALAKTPGISGISP